MEAAPHPDSQEIASQPDLLEVFGDREVTIFGVTGTFTKLAEMCPLDPSDPRMTVEATNEFVIKVANEAGLAIAPEHEALFSRIIETNGLERKFTTIEPTRDNKIEEVQVTHDNQVPKQATISHSYTVRDERKRQPAETYAAVIHAQALMEGVVYEAHVQDSTTEKIQQPVNVRVEFEAGVIIPRRSETSPDIAVIMDDRPEVSDVLSGEGVTPNPQFEYVFQKEPDVLLSSEEAEISAELLIVYESFVDALRIFAELSTVPELANDHDPILSQFEDQELEQQPMPAIVTAVAEKLAELEPTEIEEVEPILADIAAAIHEVQSIEVTDDPEALALAEAELVELCEMLFESIGIEYDEQDIEKFIQVILHPEFQAQLVTKAELDLEHTGTREVKRHLAQFNNGLTRVETEFRHILGTFTLQCARRTDTSLLNTTEVSYTQ